MKDWGARCVPRASQIPEGCVTYISSGAYYWSPDNLHNLSLSDAKHKAERKRAP